ncbi:ATP-dependent helicase BRM, partial [Tanacetum coccineum]
LWKRTGSQGSSAGNNLLDPWKIELRIERLKYNGVMELIADVQAMLKGGMQYFEFSHEVRSEAKKVHDLFFDIMKIAFPDTDFREARSALTFSGSVASSSPRGLLPIGQTKRNKQIVGPESETSLLQRPLSRGSIPPRETRFANSMTQCCAPASPQRVGGRSPLTHPGELVICKKKRKDRGPVSPIGRVASGPGQTRPSQSQTVGRQGNGNGPSIGWANPVKRMRTDAGKRRPSQL